MGGVAVALHAPQGLPEPLRRSYGDIDLVTVRKAGRDTTRLLTELGYEPNERFNAINGTSRLVLYDRPNNRQVDVFIGDFRMCHRIPIADRLQVDSPTLPLAELLLTKLQIVQLNEKDLLDIYALLVSHDVADHDDDAVNADLIATLLSSDWGLWRTARQVVETARAQLQDSRLTAEQQQVLDDRLARLWETVERRPKSVRWRSRARIGERARWFDDPEEIAHGAL